VKRTDVEQVGDSKLPNRYYVSISDDYYICRHVGKETLCDWASELKGDHEPVDGKGGTIAVFGTYVEAKDYLDNIPINEYLEDIHVRNARIEDRFTGELTESSVYQREVCRDEQNIETNESLEFTKNAMAKRGASFF